MYQSGINSEPARVDGCLVHTADNEFFPCFNKPLSLLKVIVIKSEYLLGTVQGT